MFKNVQMYIYAGLILFAISVLSYIGYVFYDRAEAKKTIIKKDGVIETKKIEVQTTSIAEKAKGAIEQINKEDTHEADTSVGTHHHPF